MCSAPATDPVNITEDGFLGGRITILQPRRGHRSGSDAVLLAAAVPAHAGARALEAGAGVGAASFCLASRVPGLQLTLVEQDKALCALARSNAAGNGFDAQIINGDVTAPGACARFGLPPEGFDHVFANPPFYSQGSTRTRHETRPAHVMRKGGLSAWLRFLAAVCRPGGMLTLIHRPEILPELLQAIEGRFGGATLLPLFPRDGRPAERLLVRAVKGSRAQLSIRPGLVLHEADGSYAEAAEAILRHGRALEPA